MIQLVPFHPLHATLIDAQPMQRMDISREQVEELAAVPDAYTLLDGDRVIAYAGLQRQWENRAIAWARLAVDSGRHLVRVHRAVADHLDRSHVRRIEMYVDAEFAQAHRWARMLGFEVEAFMRKFTQDGRDCFLYARVR